MARVRLYGYAGIVQIQQTLVKQFTGHGVFLRQEPYQWVAAVDLNGLVAVETAVQTADGLTTVVFVELPDGVQVRYEVNPGGPLGTNHRNAFSDSPRFSGDNPVQWFKGATISFIDATGT